MGTATGDDAGGGVEYNQETATSPNYGSIYDAADSVEVEFLKSDASGNIIMSEGVTSSVQTTQTNTFGAGLDLSSYYKTRVRSKKGSLYSD